MTQWGQPPHDRQAEKEGRTSRESWVCLSFVLLWQKTQVMAALPPACYLLVQAVGFQGNGGPPQEPGSTAALLTFAFTFLSAAFSPLRARKARESTWP